MKSLLFAILTFIGLTMFAPQAEARHYTRHYSGHSGHYYRHGHYYPRVAYRSHYYPRYYGSSYYSGYYPRYRSYGYYPAAGYCYPRYYRPGITFAFRF